MVNIYQWGNFSKRINQNTRYAPLTSRVLQTPLFKKRFTSLMSLFLQKVFNLDSPLVFRINSISNMLVKMVGRDKFTLIHSRLITEGSFLNTTRGFIDYIRRRYNSAVSQLET
jgi:hypothetical protein